jgi:signal transduction histidine kinase
MEKWQDPKVIAFWIAIIIAFIATLLFFVIRILHAGYKRMTEANIRENRIQLEHQKKLMETNLHAQEKERMRIAGDLHDSLIGKLVVIKMKSQIGAAANELDALLEEGIAEARRISHDLTPPLLEFSPVEELVEDIFTPWKEKYTIVFHKDVRNSTDMPPQDKIQALRIVQELLTNIIKHAAADTITLQLRYTQKYFSIVVRDNGKGFDTTLHKKGLGLGNLELRMQYLNASHKVKSAEGRGTATIIAAAL